MARPRSADFEGHQEQILSAAAALFAREGYAGATMAALAEACGLSKATLYHYVRDKQALLAEICTAHVARLEALVAAVHAEQLAPQAHLRALIEQFTAAYAGARDEHRVLTEDVRFLAPARRRAVLDGQRRVVDAFADAVRAVRPELAVASGASMPKALAMLLFGMINWMHTWMKPDGAYSHASLAPVVADLFVGGLSALTAPSDGSAAPGIHPAAPQADQAGSSRSREHSSA
jgi:AcrR family transcriptional regulator